MGRMSGTLSKSRDLFPQLKAHCNRCSGGTGIGHREGGDIAIVRIAPAHAASHDADTTPHRAYSGPLN